MKRLVLVLRMVSRLTQAKQEYDFGQKKEPPAQYPPQMSFDQVQQMMQQRYMYYSRMPYPQYGNGQPMHQMPPQSQMPPMQPQVQPKQQAFSLEQVEAQLRSMRPVDDFGQRSVGMYPQSGYPAPNQLPQMVQQPPQMQQQHLQQQNAHQQQAQSVQQQQQQKKVQQQQKAASSQKSAQEKRSNQQERPERQERQERPERSAQQERQERQERSAQQERQEKQERQDRLDKQQPEEGKIKILQRDESQKKKQKPKKEPEEPVERFDPTDFPDLKASLLPKKEPKIEKKMDFSEVQLVEEDKRAAPRNPFARVQPQKKTQEKQSQQKRKKEHKLDASEFFNISSYQEEPDSDENLPREEKYKGLMRKFEKDLIAKIQIANLVTEDPYKDDFYYQLFTVIKESPVPTKKGLKPLLQTQLVKASSVSNHMQQQMKRLIENRKQRPQREQVSLEGALGKISVQSTKNPKKTIQLTEIAVNVFEKQDYKSTLLAIEKVYKIVLVLEQLKRQIPDEQEELVEWEDKLNTNKQLLFKSLFLMDQIPLTDAHPFVNLLNYNKGMKILSRVFRFMSPDQIFAVYSTIFTRLECLDVINGDKEETEIFLSTVVPQFVTLASDLGFGRVNQLMSILLERHNMVWMCKSSCGLSLLTVLLSRAETLKQEGAKEQEQSAWSEIYNFLFMSLQNQFAQLFVTEKAQDNLYLWQFLSAMAVGASGVEHQGILITEIREHVIKAAKSNDPRSLDNVNLFLKALGLGIDAQQLAQMG